MIANIFSPLIKMLDRWASKRVVRVAIFGQGLALSEWESLSTTPYLKISPRIQLVHQPTEAEVLAIHGPLSELNFQLLEDWVAKARGDAKILAVGSELQVDNLGSLTIFQNVSSFKVDRVLPGQPPTPEELIQTVKSLMESTHV